ncbi:IS110 family transposase [Dactylosporangium sp. NPDC051541]|uniref:IS110 family transposase n=1 Tax=Dactylosporangium sp. NPDC051541 TaxID=3363977 RepID=UPI0037ACB284
MGLDVGKDGHHAVGLAPAGKRLHDAALPNTEAKLRALFDKLGRPGTVPVVVDQPASIGALPVAVARACGHEVAYQPGPAMRRIADLRPGTAKTDARDASVIADAARTLPHTLRRVDSGDETSAELGVLVGYDDLAGEVTRVGNRIRGLLNQIHPALERVLGPKVQPPAVLELLSRCGGPAGPRHAGRAKLTGIVTTRAPRSIRGEHPPKGGNKQLKLMFFRSAFASLAHPPSRAYCDRERAQGKRHNAALVRLARRRVDILHAMLRTRITYQPPQPGEPATRAA